MPLSREIWPKKPMRKGLAGVTDLRISPTGERTRFSITEILRSERPHATKRSDRNWLGEMK